MMRVGTRLFSLDSEIGRGAYGAVFTIQDDPGSVIKCVEVSQSKTYDAMTEILLMREINNENVLHVHAWVCTDLFIYIKLDRFDIDLHHLLDRGRLHVHVAVRVMTQLMNALKSCHELGIAHRDVKPANILVRERDFHIVLTDFGISKKLTGKALSLDVVTFMYRPPEIMIYKQRYSCTIDVWSAGCVYAEMLRGGTLFNAPEDTMIVQLREFHLYLQGRIPLGRMNWFNRQSPDQQQLWKKMMAYTPKQRISADECHREWVRIERSIFIEELTF